MVTCSAIADMMNETTRELSMLSIETGRTSTQAKYWKKSFPAYNESFEATNSNEKNNMFVRAILAVVATTLAKKPETTAKQR